MSLPEAGALQVADTGDDRTAAGIRQAARWLLAGTIFGVIAFTTTVTFRSFLLSQISVIVQPVLLAIFVWRLDSVMPRRRSGLGMTTSLLGFAGAILTVAAGIGSYLVDGLEAVAPLSLFVLGGWLAAFGSSRPPLPRPLPRRAIVAGVGWMLAGLAFGILTVTREPLLLIAAIGLAAFVCSLSAFGLLFGLIDLERLGPAETA